MAFFSWPIKKYLFLNKKLPNLFQGLLFYMILNDLRLQHYPAFQIYQTLLHLGTLAQKAKNYGKWRKFWNCCFIETPFSSWWWNRFYKNLFLKQQSSLNLFLALHESSLFASFVATWNVWVNGCVRYHFTFYYSDGFDFLDFYTLIIPIGENLWISEQKKSQQNGISPSVEFVNSAEMAKSMEPFCKAKPGSSRKIRQNQLMEGNPCLFT